MRFVSLRNFGPEIFFQASPASLPPKQLALCSVQDPDGNGMEFRDQVLQEMKIDRPSKKIERVTKRPAARVQEAAEDPPCSCIQFFHGNIIL